ncbi:hypothetical protein NMS01_003878 [Vibrio cholerae]|uniref:hypothetical protein n=1 Tax=Vibrio cholerae TaxID=666 RepID=UPI000F40B80E|nr:hypothetical protein [Vibrio cholerae]EGQ7881757.1 hypothetical protein [Vibrio cholerae]EGX7709291.1 hypothetical protein [Vibrio cholerae]EHC9837494.1 hypothetical protein [Vibrio cholerae]EID7720878.1 hypothetical protein [Vibrio cholerae]EJL6409452.1 hypothetical protein [Vibrio cholerae]
MELIRNQILGGTSIDRQGEKLTYEFLNDFCNTFKGKRMPLNQQHDLGLKTIGYAENLRLERFGNSDKEWSLIGDLFVDRDNLEIAVGGFSISGVEEIKSENNPDFFLYIPFPYYNDAELLESLSESNKINLGKWIKKNNDPESWAIFAATVAFALTPVWDDFYKTVVAPKIKKFVSEEFPKLAKKGIGLQHVQIIDYHGCEIEIRFIGERGREKECYSLSIMRNAISMVQHELDTIFSTSDPVSRIVLCYNKDGKSYFVHRIEKDSGSVEHYA